ncbi:alginate export family protein [Microbulbifer hainanensis]|uniref:alginate export family protein n=1 Tax=Microbulbifer hainanensis TaxID=2735675 RepID=UPI001868BF31|nr:alginate export family protein [Microbulbifer hainanensis]
MKVSALVHAIRQCLLVAAGTSVIVLPAAADTVEAKSLTGALANGDVSLDLRYRFEGVEQDNLTDDARASTLRSRLTWDSGSYLGFSTGLELDDVTAIGDDDYNSTVNGNTDFPVVADPVGTEVNRVFIRYSKADFTATGGRQRINLDNQRFVGGVGWRQNEQTYDGYRFQYGSEKTVSLDYSYVYNVNRIFGEDSAKGDLGGDIQIFRASYPLAEGHRLTGYLLDLDLDQSVNLSSRTLALNYDGTFGPVKARLGAGQQQEAGDSTLDYSAPYYLAELATDLGPVNTRVGYEVLGSDNGVGFATPLATLHAFQGFADQFLTTPAEGVEDRYLNLSSALLGGKVGLAYHRFDAAEGSARWGNEVDVSYGRALTKQLSFLVKYASYSADDYGVDTDKVWLMLSARF